MVEVDRGTKQPCAFGVKASLRRLRLTEHDANGSAQPEGNDMPYRPASLV